MGIVDFFEKELKRANINYERVKDSKSVTQEQKTNLLNKIQYYETAIRLIKNDMK